MVTGLNWEHWLGTGLYWGDHWRSLGVTGGHEGVTRGHWGVTGGVMGGHWWSLGGHWWSLGFTGGVTGGVIGIHWGVAGGVTGGHWSELGAPAGPLAPPAGRAHPVATATPGPAQARSHWPEVAARSPIGRCSPPSLHPIKPRWRDQPDQSPSVALN